MKSYGVLRLCGKVLSVIAGVLLAVVIAATFLNLFYGQDIDGAGGECLKLIIALGVGQSFIAIADAAEHIQGLSAQRPHRPDEIRRQIEKPELSSRQREASE